jgi:hypothetical protein
MPVYSCTCLHQGHSTSGAFASTFMSALKGLLHLLQVQLSRMTGAWL